VCQVESTTKETLVLESFNGLGRFQVSAIARRGVAGITERRVAIDARSTFFMAILGEWAVPLKMHHPPEKRHRAR
jgi:hypothetical protein